MASTQPASNNTAVGFNEPASNNTAVGFNEPASYQTLFNEIFRNIPSREWTYFDIVIPSVPEIPTQEQIREATRETTFNNIVRPINLECSICQETFTDTSNVIMINHCKHIFHRNCIHEWFVRNSNCPVCRHNIIT